MKDQTYYGSKITVLRHFGGNKILVARGTSLSLIDEEYKEFDQYIDAIDYFNKIKI